MSINEERKLQRGGAVPPPFHAATAHVRAAAPAQAPTDLEAEVTLLREDNARLKAAQHRPADLGSVLEKVRALPGGRFANRPTAT